MKAGLLEQQLKTVVTHTHSSVTENVAETIRECEGLLQFYMADVADDDRVWLNAEYFLACALRKPHIRIAEEDAMYKFEKDQAARVIKNGAGTDEIRGAVSKAFRQLVEKITGAR